MAADKEIRALFAKLNPNFKLHISTINEILYYGCFPRAEFRLQKRLTIPISVPPGITLSYKNCSLTKAREQLDRFERDVLNQKASTFPLHTTTASALHFANFNQSFLSGDPVTISESFAEARKLIRKWDIAYPQMRSARSGQPEKKAPLRIAKVLAEEFFRATGSSPRLSTDPYNDQAPSGKFYELVAGAFKILGIKASPRVMAEKAATLWIKNHELRMKAHEAITARAAEK